MLQGWNLAKTFLRYVSFIPQSMSVIAEHYFQNFNVWNEHSTLVIVFESGLSTNSGLPSFSFVENLQPLFVRKTCVFSKIMCFYDFRKTVFFYEFWASRASDAVASGGNFPVVGTFLMHQNLFLRIMGFAGLWYVTSGGNCPVFCNFLMYQNLFLRILGFAGLWYVASGGNFPVFCTVFDMFCHIFDIFVIGSTFCHSFDMLAITLDLKQLSAALSFDSSFDMFVIFSTFSS